LKRLLIPVLIAMIVAAHASALSDGTVSASKDALDILTAWSGPSGTDLMAESGASSYSYYKLKGISEEEKVGDRIASPDLMVSSSYRRLDALPADDTDKKNDTSDLSIASSTPGSEIATNLNRHPSGSEMPVDLSANYLLIASSDLAESSSNLDRLVADETYIDDGESYFRVSKSDLRSNTGANLDCLLSEMRYSEKTKRNYPSMESIYDKSRDVQANLNRASEMEIDLSIADLYVGSYGPSDPDNLYKYAENIPPDSAVAAALHVKSSDIIPRNNANLNYKYEQARVVNEKTQITHLLGGSDPVHDIDSNFDYIQEILNYNSEIDSEKEDPENDQRLNSALSSGSWGPSAVNSFEISHIERYLRPDINQNIESLIQNGEITSDHIVPYLFERWDEEEKIDEIETEDAGNYAVVVGINSYSDWRGLRTSVNDANEISEILKACGYQVIELTDKTDMKPTKENILSMSLEDLRTKQHGGNIIFYFSGHGVRDDDGTFYLVPQDAKNGDLSTMISELELRGYMKDLNNLAVIIDACNSGDLKIAGDGQLVLTSSKKDEPSNEKWFGSLSVFTYNLIKAIDEEMRSTGNVSLSECFFKARDETVRWSNRRLMSQTPEIIDLTGGNYRIR